jgi:hypothetical protein
MAIQNLTGCLLIVHLQEKPMKGLVRSEEHMKNVKDRRTSTTFVKSLQADAIDVLPFHDAVIGKQAPRQRSCKDLRQQVHLRMQPLAFDY